MKDISFFFPIRLLTRWLFQTPTHPQMWLGVLGTGNANFFYGMNLLWAGWQGMMLVQVLRGLSVATAASKPATDASESKGANKKKRE